MILQAYLESFEARGRSGIRSSVLACGKHWAAFLDWGLQSGGLKAHHRAYMIDVVSDGFGFFHASLHHEVWPYMTPHDVRVIFGSAPESGFVESMQDAFHALAATAGLDTDTGMLPNEAWAFIDALRARKVDHDRLEAWQRRYRLQVKNGNMREVKW